MRLYAFLTVVGTTTRRLDRISEELAVDGTHKRGIVSGAFSDLSDR
jgi:hypothetical protein